MVINRGVLRGGKIVFGVFRINGYKKPFKKILEFESNWAIIPGKGEIIDFSNCDVEELKDIPEKVFKVFGVRYKPGKDWSMGNDIYKVDVYVSLEPYSG